MPIHTIRPALHCLRHAARRLPKATCSPRSFTASTHRKDESLEPASSPAPSPPPITPNTISTPPKERQISAYIKGPRRRRGVILPFDAMPFEQMPYQCFQEARAVLAEERVRKLAEIETMKKRIARWQDVPASDLGGEYVKKGKLVRMQNYLEKLKILADSNDPVIKKRFEDGMGLFSFSLLISITYFVFLSLQSIGTAGYLIPFLVKR